MLPEPIGQISEPLLERALNVAMLYWLHYSYSMEETLPAEPEVV